MSVNQPVEVWFHSNPKASETNFEADLLKLVTAKTLLLLDRGFYHFQAEVPRGKLPPRTLLFFANLISQQVHFITRLKAGAAVQVVQVFTSQHDVRDQLIKLGTGRNDAPILTLRRVEIRFGKTWYSYITSVLDPVVLPPYVVADLYRRRWRIEEAFNTVKRLLGLSYLWTGSIPRCEITGVGNLAILRRFS